MEKLTLDMETLTVESFQTGLPEDACPTASAGGTTSPARP